MTRASLLIACILALVSGAAGAHTTSDPSQPVPAQRLLLKERKFVFRMANGAAWLPTDLDPRTIETGLLVSGSDGRSALVDLDPTLWQPIVRGKGRRARVVGYRYRDKSGARGGVTHALLRDGRLTLRGSSEGLGFLPEAIVDQHFIRRERHNRLMSAVLERPSLLGVGIDESTALEVRPDGRWRVLGESAVVIYDARRAHVTDGRQPLLGATGLQVHVLPSGAVFDPRTGGGL